MPPDHSKERAEYVSCLIFVSGYYYFSNQFPNNRSFSNMFYFYFTCILKYSCMYIPYIHISLGKMAPWRFSLTMASFMTDVVYFLQYSICRNPDQSLQGVTERINLVLRHTGLSFNNSPIFHQKAMHTCMSN